MARIYMQFTWFSGQPQTTITLIGRGSLVRVIISSQSADYASYIQLEITSFLSMSINIDFFMFYNAVAVILLLQKVLVIDISCSNEIIFQTDFKYTLYHSINYPQTRKLQTRELYSDVTNQYSLENLFWVSYFIIQLVRKLYLISVIGLTQFTRIFSGPEIIKLCITNL